MSCRRPPSVLHCSALPFAGCMNSNQRTSGSNCLPLISGNRAIARPETKIIGGPTDKRGD